MTKQTKTCRICHRDYHVDEHVATMTTVLDGGYFHESTVTTIDIGSDSDFRVADGICPACHLCGDPEGHEHCPICWTPRDEQLLTALSAPIKGELGGAAGRRVVPARRPDPASAVPGIDEEVEEWVPGA